jgi:hypothetical protein
MSLMISVSGISIQQIALGSKIAFHPASWMRQDTSTSSVNAAADHHPAS